MKKVFALFAVVLTALVLTACAKDYTATGYGLVHGHYVGVADITVDSEGVVKKLKFEEYYLAYNAAQVEAPTDLTRDDIITIGEGESKTYFAKYYNVDGKVFVSAGERSWTHPTHGDLEEWVKVEANAKAYVEAVKAGKVFISKADGTKVTDLKVTGNAATDMTKSKSGYGGERWKWADAMEGLEEILEGTKLDVTYELNDDKKWVVAGEVTSATLVDFADYFAVAKRAHATATK